MTSALVPLLLGLSATPHVAPLLAATFTSTASASAADVLSESQDETSSETLQIEARSSDSSGASLASGASGISRSSRPSAFRTRSHLGIELHYSGATAAMDDSNRVYRQISNEDQFGFAHGGELSMVYVSPWRFKARVGVGALYDTGTSQVTVPVVNALTGEQVGEVQAKLTGRAVGVVVPILLGYRYDFLDDKLAASVEGGVEIMPFSRLSCSVEGAQSGCSPLSSGASLGGTARADLAWHIVPQFAIDVGVVWRTLQSGNLRFKGATTDYVDGAGRTAKIDFSGVGFVAGIGGYFF